MVFVVPGGPEVVAISVWKTREDLENYARGAYRKVLGMLENLIEKQPQVEVYQLAYSTIHRTGLSEFPKQSPHFMRAYRLVTIPDPPPPPPPPAAAKLTVPTKVNFAPAKMPTQFNIKCVVPPWMKLA